MILFRKFMNPSLPQDIEAALETGDLAPVLRGGLEEAASTEDSGDRERGPFGAPGRGAVHRFLSLPLMRPALGLAAVVVLVLVICQVWLPPESPGPTILRGSTESSVLNANPELLDDGRVRISWGAFAEDVSYQVVFYDVQQVELLRLSADSTNSVMLDPDAEPALKEAKAGLLWRVVAMRDGEEILRSPMRSLRLAW
jgi:hypothetical protein